MSNKYALDQTDASIVELFNSVRQETLDNAIREISKNTQILLDKQDVLFAKALSQIDQVQSFIDKPENILGRSDTKHGEIAERVEVAIQNYKSLLKGFGICASADPDIVGRTINAPTDYIVRGKNVQSKFINSEVNTLNHVIEHLKKYKIIDYGRTPESYYNIPKDQYNNIIHALKTGSIEGRRVSSVEVILDKVREIEEITGRKFTDAVRSAHVKYGEVQWGKIDGTLEKIRFDVQKENTSIIENIEKDEEKEKYLATVKNAPSLDEAVKIAGLSSTVNGAIAFIGAAYRKYKQGVSLENYTYEDWKDLGLDVTDSSLRGGVSAFALYGLTNCVGISAPIAAGAVSATLGIIELVYRYNADEITFDKLMEEGRLLCLNSAASTLGSVIGQQIIPIPVLGAVIGSLAGTYCVNIVSSLVGEEEANCYQRENWSQIKNELILGYYKPLILKYGENLDLMNIAFDFNENYELKLLSSQELARKTGVKEDSILHNKEEIDAYFVSA